jgi:hypothetical protein
MQQPEDRLGHHGISHPSGHHDEDALDWGG